MVIKSDGGFLGEPKPKTDTRPLCDNLNCTARVGAIHERGCPHYVEPTYTMDDIQRFMRNFGRQFTNPSDGEKENIMALSDGSALEEFIHGPRP